MQVLLIDDNVEITDLVAYYLDDMIDTVCTVANSGAHGLELIRDGDFDLILLDIAMPDLNGMDVLNSLKRDGLLKSNNIILFTAVPLTDKDLQELLESGVKGIIRKPVSIDDLEGIVKKFRS